MNKLNYLLLIILTAFMNKAVAQDSLDHYLQLAMENNPSLLSSYHGFYAATKRSGSAVSLPDPTLGMGYFISPVETRVGPQQFRFSLTQMFPWFGTLKARREQFDELAEASFWEFTDKARIITRNVRTRYYDLWTIRKLIELEEDNILLLNSMEKLATTRFQSGDGRMAEILAIQLEIKSALNTQERLKDELTTKTNQFFLLLNSEPSGLTLPDTIIAELQPFSLQDSLAGHPLVQAQRSRSDAASAYAATVKKQRYPSLGIGIDYMVIGKRDDMTMADNGKNALMPMVTVGLPVWRKKYTAMREEAEASGKQFDEAAVAEQTNLVTQLMEAEFDLRRAREELRVYEEQIDLATRMMKLTESDFANDRADFDEILEYQQRLLNYRKELIKKYGELLNAVARYDYLTGENPAIVNKNIE